MCHRRMSQHLVWRFITVTLRSSALCGNRSHLFPNSLTPAQRIDVSRSMSSASASRSLAVTGWVATMPCTDLGTQGRSSPSFATGVKPFRHPTNLSATLSLPDFDLRCRCSSRAPWEVRLSEILAGVSSRSWSQLSWMLNGRSRLGMALSCCDPCTAARSLGGRGRGIAEPNRARRVSLPRFSAPSVVVSHILYV